MIEGIFVDGLVFSIMVIGILISYRILIGFSTLPT